MKQFLPGLAVVIALALVIFGCGGGALTQNHGGGTSSTSSSNTSTTGSTTSGATGGVLVSAANGGVVTSQTGNVLLNIPAKALPANAKISINAVPTTTTLPTLPANLTILSGTAYQLGPSGEFFGSSPTLRMVYSPTNVPSGVSERDLHVYGVVNNAWQPLLNCVIDPVNHIVTVPITQLNVYAVVSVQSYSGTPAYDLIDIGTISGDNASVAEGLSSNGLAVGISSSASGVHAFLWNQGSTTNLGMRAGDAGARAYCVDSSTIAGGTSIQNTIYNFPVLFSGGVATQVDTAAGQGAGTVTAINDAGEYIVGGAIVMQGSLTAFSGFNPSGYSTALNSSGTVAGTTTVTSTSGTTTTTSTEAAFWSGGSVTTAGLLSGYDTSVGVAMSDTGTMVGTAYNASNNKPIGFMYSGGTMAAINPLSGDDILIPYGANDGAVVGQSTKDFTTTRGFVYNGSTAVDLNTLIPSGTGCYINSAIAINDNGVILCNGNNGSANHALLLVPRPSTTPAIGHASPSTPTLIRRK